MAIKQRHSRKTPRRTHTNLFWLEMLLARNVAYLAAGWHSAHASLHVLQKAGTKCIHLRVWNTLSGSQAGDRAIS